MQCRSTRAGHNLDRAKAELVMATSEPKPGFLRLLLHGPLIVWFDGSHEGFGYDQLYWAHDGEDIVRTAAEGPQTAPGSSSTRQIGPLDPDVWVPTVAYKVMAKNSAPNYTPAARIDIWKDEFIAVPGAGDEPVLFSVASMDDRTTCDRTDVLGVCPNCGSGELKEVFMGYPPFNIVGDPNYELGGCCVSGNEPRWSCASCGHGWS